MSRRIDALALCAALGALGCHERRPAPAPSAPPLAAGESFAVVVDAPGGAKPLGATCKPGDVLRAQYAGQGKYLVVFDLAPGGEVRPVFPESGRGSAMGGVEPALSPQPWTLGPGAGRECAVAFFGDAPVDVGDAARAAREGGAPPGARRADRCCDKRAP